MDVKAIVPGAKLPTGITYTEWGDMCLVPGYTDVKRVYPYVTGGTNDIKERDHVERMRNTPSKSKRTFTDVSNDVIDDVIIIEGEMFTNTYMWSCVFTIQGRRYASLVNRSIVEDAIANTGIRRNGILTGKYQWITRYGHLHLARIGSAAHTSATTRLERGSTKLYKNVKVSTLKPGDICVNLHGMTNMYIGRFKHLKCFDVEGSNPRVIETKVYTGHVWYTGSYINQVDYKNIVRECRRYNLTGSQPASKEIVGHVEVDQLAVIQQYANLVVKYAPYLEKWTAPNNAWAQYPETNLMPIAKKLIEEATYTLGDTPVVPPGLTDALNNLRKYMIFTFPGKKDVA